MQYAQARIDPGKWDMQTSLRFWDPNDHLIPAKRPDGVLIYKKKQLAD